MSAFGPGAKPRPFKGCFCPVCGAPAELTKKGTVTLEWREPYGHRAPSGEPCRGSWNRPEVKA